MEVPRGHQASPLTRGPAGPELHFFLFGAGWGLRNASFLGVVGAAGAHREEREEKAPGPVAGVPGDQPRPRPPPLHRPLPALPDLSSLLWAFALGLPPAWNALPSSSQTSSRSPAEATSSARPSLTAPLYSFLSYFLVLSVTGFPGGSDGKESAHNVGDLGLISGSSRSPGEGNGCPLQCSCLESPMDRGAWWAAVHGVTKSRHS